MENEKYKVRGHMFKGSNEFGYTYEITFNKSLEHTGKFTGIEDGLNSYDKKERKENVFYSFKIFYKSLINWLKHGK